MALIIADRVKETATTTGTGTFTLGGAVTGFRTFNAGIGTGNTTYYCIFLDGTNEFEVGLGTYTAPDQLARDTVLASSNAGSKVNFSQGIKSVFCTQPSSKAAYLDASGNLSITTSNITEGTNLYYTDARFDTRLATKDTADLSEGTNLYYTDARARAAISVSGNAIAYNSSTGVITANFEESPTFTGNVVVSGNLTVTGTTTWLDSTNTQISDKNIVLNYASGDSSANADGAGITIQDAVDASTDASLTWDTTLDAFKFSNNLHFNDGIQANFGTSSDLQILHDGTHSYIKDVGTGSLRIRGTDLLLESQGGETFLYAANNGAVTLYYDNAAKLATTSSGIDVTGTVVADQIDLGDNERIRFGASQDLEIYHDGTQSLISETGTGNLSINGTSINFNNNDLGGRYAEFVSNGAVNLFHAGSKKFETTSSGIDVTGGIAITKEDTTGNALLITNNGSSRSLEINHNADNSGIVDEVVRIMNNGTRLFTMESNGNVGIGTSSAVTKLQLHQADSGANYLRFTNTDSGNGLDVGINDAEEAIIFNRHTTDLRFLLNGADRVKFAANGNVGIGTTSPSEKLDVVGTVKSNGFSTNTSGVSNFIAGVNAGNSIISGGEYNTLIGDEAGTSITTGDFNVAVGTFSLDALTTASENTAIGYASLSNNITGTRNVASGFRALQLSTSDDNTATGYFALYSTTGSNNTAIGKDAGRLITTGSKNTIIGSFDGNEGGLDIRTSDNYIVLSDGDGNPRQVIDSSGNVGIGTSSPSEKLHISGSSNTTARIITTSTTFAADYAALSLVGGDNEASIRSIHGGGGAGVLAFFNENAERMRIDSSGNVGIGTISPSRKLQVYNTSAAAVLAITTSTTNLAQLALGDTDDDNYAQILLDNSTNKLQIQNGGGGAIGNRGITLDSSENVGIGTTSPTEKLQVNGKIKVSNGGNLFIDSTATDAIFAATGSQFMRFETNSAERMRITSAGNVGIGTTSPSYKTEIVGGGNYSQLRLASSVSDNTTKYSALTFEQYDADEEGFLGLGGFSSSSENALIVGGGTGSFNAATRVSFITAANGTTTAGSERMRIDSSGNVGIGTASPSALLDVNIDGNTGRFSRSGTQYIEVSANSGGQSILSTSGTNKTLFIGTTDSNQLRLQTNGSNALSIDTSQNVGIGTSSPSTKLDVLGDALIQGRLQIGASTPDLLFSVPSGGVDSRIFNDGSGNFIIGHGTNSSTPTERVRIDSLGNFLVGKTSANLATAGIELTASNFANFTRDGGLSAQFNRLTSDGAVCGFLKAGTTVGTISVTASATAYNTSSDARLKDITGSARGLAVINELNPVAYDWKADGKSDEGLIAQEVMELVPNAVSQNEDGYYQMDYSKLVTPLIKAIQELTAKVESLEAQLANK